MKNNCVTIRYDGNFQYDFSKLIDILSTRTEMHTGGGSSSQNFRSFLAGAERLFNDINEFLEENSMPSEFKKLERIGVEPDSNFSRWLDKKFNFGSSSVGWDGIITAISLGFKNYREVEDWDNLDQLASVEDHRKARELFYQLLDEYKTEINTKQ